MHIQKYLGEQSSHDYEHVDIHAKYTFARIMLAVKAKRLAVPDLGFGSTNTDGAQSGLVGQRTRTHVY